MSIQEYRDNRPHFTEEELRPFDGQWAAFSGDGRRLIAASSELRELPELVKQAGEDPEAVWYERIVFEDPFCVSIE